MSAPTNNFRKRLNILMKTPENKICADCSAPRPTWASIIIPPPEAPSDSKRFGVFCCLECSGTHRRLGVHLCFVRSVNLDEWKEHEVMAMEFGSNKIVNEIYESNRAAVGALKPNPESDLATRELFIRKKYDSKEFYNSSALVAFYNSKESFVTQKTKQILNKARSERGCLLSVPEAKRNGILSSTNISDNQISFTPCWESSDATAAAAATTASSNENEKKHAFLLAPPEERSRKNMVLTTNNIPDNELNFTSSEERIPRRQRSNEDLRLPNRRRSVSPSAMRRKMPSNNATSLAKIGCPTRNLRAERRMSFSSMDKGVPSPPRTKSVAVGEGITMWKRHVRSRSFDDTFQKINTLNDNITDCIAKPVRRKKRDEVCRSSNTSTDNSSTEKTDSRNSNKGKVNDLFLKQNKVKSKNISPKVDKTKLSHVIEKAAGKKSDSSAKPVYQIVSNGVGITKIVRVDDIENGESNSEKLVPTDVTRRRKPSVDDVHSPNGQGRRSTRNGRRSFIETTLPAEYTSPTQKNRHSSSSSSSSPSYDRAVTDSSRRRRQSSNDIEIRSFNARMLSVPKIDTDSSSSTEAEESPESPVRQSKKLSSLVNAISDIAAKNSAVRC